MKYNLKNFEEMLENPECNWESVRSWVVGFEQELRELLKVKHTSAEFDIYRDKLINELLGEEAS